MLRLTKPLCTALADSPVMPVMTGNAVIGVIDGEGVGPKVVGAALDVLEALRPLLPFRCELRRGGKIGLPAVAECGRPLCPEIEEFCQSVFNAGGAVLCGPGGGRFVYDLRQRFDLYAKFTPVCLSPALLDTGVVSAATRRDVDIVIVRENTGGLYFGEWESRSDPQGTTCAYHSVEYTATTVDRVLQVALRLARQRRSRLSLVVKSAGVPSISRLWIDRLDSLSAAEAIETNVLDIDNAAYQIVAAARQFDVVVAPNMFGDVLADVAALLLGSRGMSYSGNFGPGCRAVYQTGHGAAHDLAGADVANPAGQILSLAMMLRESFGCIWTAEAIESAVESTLRSAWRTADVTAARTRVVGTREFGQRVGPCCPLQATRNRKLRLKVRRWGNP